MLVHNAPYPPNILLGQLFISGRNWTQIAADTDPPIRNHPFGPNDMERPYQHFKMVGVFFGPHDLEIAFDLDRVDAESVEAVRTGLANLAEQKPTAIRYFKDGWALERYASPTEALARIDQLLLHQGVRLLHHTILHQVPMSCLQTRGLLRESFDAWCANKSLEDFRTGPQSYTSVVLSAESGVMRFEEIGPASASIEVFGESWRHFAVGRPADDSHDDAHFDRSVSRGYWNALRQRKPQLDRVLTSLHLDGRPTWTSYDRLILPFEGSVVSMCRLVPLTEIGIPFLRA